MMISFLSGDVVAVSILCDILRRLLRKTRRQKKRNTKLRNLILTKIILRRPKFGIKPLCKPLQKFKYLIVKTTQMFMQSFNQFPTYLHLSLSAKVCAFRCKLKFYAKYRAVFWLTHFVAVSSVFGLQELLSSSSIPHMQINIEIANKCRNRPFSRCP